MFRIKESLRKLLINLAQSGKPEVVILWPAVLSGKICTLSQRVSQRWNATSANHFCEGIDIQYLEKPGTIRLDLNDLSCSGLISRARYEAYDQHTTHVNRTGAI